jgi:hypothetical protein
MNDVPDEFDSPDMGPQPGAWFIAGFDDECSCGTDDIVYGDTIRSDGDGGWERRECVELGLSVNSPHREKSTARQMIREGELRRDYS